LAVSLGVLTVAASGDSSSNETGDSKSSSDPTSPAGGTPDAVQDVTVSACAHPSDNEFLGPQAKLSVKNNSSKPSNYIITVAFESPDGSQQVDTGTALVNDLAPGQTSQTDASSLKGDLRKTVKKFNCKVASVSRFASA